MGDMHCIIFDRRYFELKQCEEWLKDHNYWNYVYHRPTETTEFYYRYINTEKGYYNCLSTRRIDKGVMAIMRNY